MAYNLNGTDEAFRGAWSDAPFRVESSGSVDKGSIVCLAKMTNAPADMTAGHFFDNTAGTGGRGRHVMFSSVNYARMYVESRTTQWDTTGLWNAGDWVHWVWTFDMVADEMSCYLNGSALTEIEAINGAYTWTQGGANYFLGERFNQTQLHNGGFAEYATYGDQLTASDAAALATGVTPVQVRPDILRLYWPLVSNKNSVTGLGALTDIGTPNLITHPRIIRPSAQILQFPKHGKIWVNDAATKDGGEVLQTYPSTWTDTSIDVGQVIDTTGLTGQLYVGIETAVGKITWRAIAVENFVITAVSGDNIIHDYETNWEITGSSFGVR